ncbi:MAG: LysE family transporter [Pseudomonadota bacterium]
MLVFATSLFLLLLTPGPGVLSLAGTGSAFGMKQGWAYGIGLFFGSNMVMLAAATGLAALFLANDKLRLVFTVLSTAYLIYLALRIALAGSKIAFIESAAPPGFWGGIALQVINPKAYAVGTFVFSNFPILPGNLVGEILLKFVVLNAIWIPIHILWLMAGVSVNELNLPARTQRLINIGMACAMLLVVGLAIWSTMYRD